MKDSMGSVIIIRIFLVFLILYIVFISVTLNFIRGYKAKNHIVEYIEKNNGWDNSSASSVNSYMNALGLRGSTNKISLPACTNNNTNCTVAVNNNYAYNVTKRTISDNLGGSYIYTATVYINFEIVPFLDFHITIPISGETKAVGN